jgi:deazaflavin-dependent oxidoreductase (nitroreductase family)
VDDGADMDLPATTPAALPSPLATSIVHRSLGILNRWFMVPMIHRGHGSWISTPLTGYVLLLRVRGRRSRQWREAPLSYVIDDGAAWVMAGFGVRTEWYRNLLVDPDVEACLPGRTLRCHAAAIDDPVTRARIVPRLARATGLPELLAGCNPWSMRPERVTERLEPYPLVRLAPFQGPITAGPDDPGGRAWIWRQTVIGLVTASLVGAGWRAGRSARRSIRAKVPQPAG